MDRVRGVSFDFWNTFVIPNKNYTKARTEYLSQFGVTKESYSDLKSQLDNMAERYGVATTPKVCLGLLLAGSNVSVNLNDVYSELSHMFFKNKPEIPDEVINSLEILKEKGMSWTITSNTNFIGGSLLRNFIYANIGYHYNDLVDYHSMQFSDEQGVSKPADKIFCNSILSLIKQTKIINGDMKFMDFLHIGDNNQCDYVGAISVGMKAKLIKTPKDILETIKKL